jgi:integrase
MSKSARGTVEFRSGRDGRPGTWWGRFTASDGSRPWIALGDWPNSPQGRARAKETAAHHAPRLKREAVGTPKRGPKAKAFRAAAGTWWDDYFAHRQALGFDSNEGTYRTHIQPVLNKPWIEVTPADCERLRDALDAKALEGKASPKTMFNAWTVFTTAAKAAAGQWKKDKPKKLRVRVDNPCTGIVPPDMDDSKELQWLYPDEFLRLVSCALVPLAARRLYALGIYLFVRASELKALDWSAVDIERGIVSIRAVWDRNANEVKPRTKTGNKGVRRFAIEQELLPLLRVMHAEANGVGPVVTMRQEKWWAADLRRHLEAAQIKRAALFRNDATSKRLRFHDLRGSGLTWMAIRGDDALKIQQRAGHTTFDMTQKYIRTAEAVGEAIGDVFPALPASLLTTTNGLANRLKDPQAVDFIVEAPGIGPGANLRELAPMMPVRSARSGGRFRFGGGRCDGRWLGVVWRGGTGGEGARAAVAGIGEDGGLHLAPRR